MSMSKTSYTGAGYGHAGYGDPGHGDGSNARGEGDVFDDDGGLETLPDLRPARLLLAEEDDELRRSIASRLRGRGYEVDEAFSGFEAIALIARQADAYDLVITDLELYGMNGLELVDELRASPHSADSEIPVILLGDEPSSEAEREAQRLHAVIIEKPCDLELLWRRAESLARPIQVDPRPN
jgi:two-component system cell cycle response regulator CpdR